MRKTIFLSLLLIIPMCSTIVAVEDKYLEVQVNDAGGKVKKMSLSPAKRGAPKRSVIAEAWPVSNCLLG
jgi:hypothetical protein